MHTLCDIGAMPDVRGRDRAGACQGGCDRSDESESRLRRFYIESVYDEAVQPSGADHLWCLRSGMQPDFETVWSSIFDLDSLVIYRAEGDPRKKKFVTDNRLHDLIRRG